MMELLVNWNLEQDWQVIQAKTVREWKAEIEKAAELMNKNKILQECETKYRGERKQKTKTKYVERLVQHSDYKRSPDELLLRNQSLTFARALIMGRYGMLECASNYSTKYGGKNCHRCNVVDDEAHRINDCILYKHINRFHSPEKITFNDIYSTDEKLSYEIVKTIMSMWDLENGKNEIRVL